jgi:hypothetical protein
MPIRVDDPIGCVVSGIDSRWVDFPDLGAEGERVSGIWNALCCYIDSTVITACDELKLGRIGSAGNDRGEHNARMSSPRGGAVKSVRISLQGELARDLIVGTGAYFNLTVC